MSQPTDSILSVARELGRCGRAWEPEARLVGNVRAADIVRLCAHVEAGAVQQEDLQRLADLATKRYYDKRDADRDTMDVLCEVLGTWADEGPDAALAWMRGVVELSGNSG